MCYCQLTSTSQFIRRTESHLTRTIPAEANVSVLYGLLTLLYAIIKIKNRFSPAYLSVTQIFAVCGIRHDRSPVLYHCFSWPPGKATTVWSTHSDKHAGRMKPDKSRVSEDWGGLDIRGPPNYIVVGSVCWQTRSLSAYLLSRMTSCCRYSKLNTQAVVINFTANNLLPLLGRVARRLVHPHVSNWYF